MRNAGRFQMLEEASPGEPGSLHSPVHHQGKDRHHDPADADGRPDAPRCSPQC